MPKKATVKSNQNAVQSVPAEFTKEQILTSKKYCSRRDLVNALLEEGKKYTIDAVDKLLNDFMKGKVE